MRQIMTPSSSQILSIAYNPDNQRLYVQFHNDKWYQYLDVEPEVVTKVLFAESIGKAFSSLIKGQPYQYAQLLDDDIVKEMNV